MAKIFWTNNEKQAKQEQLTLLNLLKLDTSLPKSLDFKIGLAIGTAYNENIKKAIAIGVKFDKFGRYNNKNEEASIEVDFPYIPGLLAFRVGPAVCQILDKVVDDIDILFFDAQGIAHPRGFGLASHMGVLYDIPSFGVTRNLLYGKCSEPPKGRFNYTEILHPKSNSLIGYSISLGTNCSPCYLSPGHLLSLQDARRILINISGVNSCFPRPLQKAHAIANRKSKLF